MKTKDIIALAPKVKNITHYDGAHLYLWVTNNYLLDGLKVVEEWGFKYITMITWMKERMGLGQYFRGITEHCIFARTPKKILPYKKREDGKRATETTGFNAPKTTHSRKPEEMRRRIESISHAPRIELFARNVVDGWDCWGNEVS